MSNSTKTGPVITLGVPVLFVLTLIVLEKMGVKKEQLVPDIKPGIFTGVAESAAR